MCSKQFTRQLKVHERMHTGEKCGEMFMKSVHLKAHLEDIHSPKPSTENQNWFRTGGHQRRKHCP